MGMGGLKAGLQRLTADRADVTQKSTRGREEFQAIPMRFHGRGARGSQVGCELALESTMAERRFGTTWFQKPGAEFHKSRAILRIARENKAQPQNSGT